ncbi:MAG: hypothetical protein FRX49_00367 [Trebouxia sp. A1-2]|nr:MAG: hypothetical protein FRX49_00367 [Trebouxia sp. A1-2]
MWSTGDCTQAGTLVSSQPIQVIQPYCSITELAVGLVAVGHFDGTIDTHNLLPENLSKEAVSDHWNTGSSDPIVDMQYCPSQKILYGLCDLGLGHGARSSLHKCDAITGQCIASAYEFMERWGLTCFCITDQDGAGNEVVAGAANTEVCIRQMSHAVYEEEYLGNFPKTETFANAEVPLPLPDRAADHQGLYLSTDGDQLLGRADNGISVENIGMFNVLKILHDVALGFVQLPGMAERGPNRPLDARQSGDDHTGSATSRHVHPVSKQHAPCNAIMPLSSSFMLQH